MHHCSLFHPELLMGWNMRLVKGEVRTYMRREPVDTYVRAAVKSQELPFLDPTPAST